MGKKLLKIDIGGKQKYIFSSNRLKVALGASYIIEEKVFDHAMDVTLKSLQKEYVGGGNAMLSYDGTYQLSADIQSFTAKILREYPGLRLEFGSANYEEGQWSSVSKDLNDDLMTNKNLHFSESRPYKSGIVEDCPISGEAQEVYNKNEGEWISEEIAAKLQAANVGHDVFENKILGADSTFALPKEFEHIGGADDKSYIAVVHIDGNGLGGKFRDCTDLRCSKPECGGNEDLEEDKCVKCYSKKVKIKLEESLKRLKDHVVELFSDGGPFDINNTSSEINLVPQEKKEESETTKMYLPFRPIINAGDDITFVCHGRLGIHLAEYYIGILNDDRIGGLSIPSCGGVALVKTKYPFYRAYELSEKLAGSAKTASRAPKGQTKSAASNDQNSCWINFMVASQGYTGDYEKMIENKYPSQHELQHGPYIVEENGIEVLPEGALHFKDLIVRMNETVYSNWPKNKLMELKEHLFKSKAALDYFGEVMLSRKYIKEKKELEKFPYVDMVDLIYFYPKSLIDYLKTD